MESQTLYGKKPGISVEEVKKIRKNEAEEAASILGCEIEFLDWGDHPIDLTTEKVLALAGIIKAYRPNIILTHMNNHPLNYDHELTGKVTFEALRCAHASGIIPEYPPVGHVEVYMFEPAQPDVVGFRPDTFIDITDVMEVKQRAMDRVAGQNYLPPFYSERASYRGNLARRHSQKEEIKYAEAYIRFGPYIGRTFQQ